MLLACSDDASTAEAGADSGRSSSDGGAGGVAVGGASGASGGNAGVTAGGSLGVGGSAGSSGVGGSLAIDAGPDGSGPPPVVGPAIGIDCPADPVPSGGWPLVFLWNGACFRSVDAGSLAVEAAGAVRTAGVACTAVLSHGDIATAADVDGMIRADIVPLIDQNRGRVNAQKIGAMGFSSGGAVATYFGTVWAEGIDSADGSDRDFRVAAVVNHYGPLRLDRSSATDSSGAITGGGGLFYLHETRRLGLDVDIPGARQWSSGGCFCASRGTSQCQCDAASALYMDAYLTASDPNPGDRICTFLSDDPTLEGLSPTVYVERTQPAHVAALYLCSGWKDSNVDHDANLHQAAAWWRPEHLVTVTADDGHGFPLSGCEAAADATASLRPLVWLAEKFALSGDFSPVRR